MESLLEHLIRMPEDLGTYEPTIERAPAKELIRDASSDRELIKAKAKTTATMLQHGLEATIDDAENDKALQQFHRHIQQLPIEPHTLNSPAVVLKLTALLSEYDHEVVQDAAQMRTYITNRLLEESGPDKPANVRMRALENLGKITGVDLFTERSEVTVKTITTENLEQRLHDRLRTLMPDEYRRIMEENPTDA